MTEHEKVNILLVDDQPAKLLSYEVILHELEENLIKASSGQEALEYLLKSEVAVVLMDVCMPDLDGFQLAAMIREHPRFQKTAMIFISAIHLTDMDRLRGYEMGAVDYVPVPVIPEVLRAKVKIFVELYRKTRQLETHERRARRTRLGPDRRARSLDRATAAKRGKPKPGARGRQHGLVGLESRHRRLPLGRRPIRHLRRQSEALRRHRRERSRPDPSGGLATAARDGLELLLKDRKPIQNEFRVKRPNGEIRWCIGTAAPSIDGAGRVTRISGVTVDITDRKIAEERQALLAREVDHRAKNALALVQSIVRLTRASDIAAYTAAVEGRIRALSRAHTILSLSRWQGADMRGLVEEELAPYRTGETAKVETSGPNVSLQPAAAQSLALALHELVTNAAKYGALSSMSGRVHLSWELNPGTLVLKWTESGGPPTQPPSSPGFGTRIITASIEGQLAGQAVFDWRPEGLQCVLSVPRDDMTPVKGRNGKRARRLEPRAAQRNRDRRQSRHDRRGRGAGRDGASRVAG